MTDTVGVWPTQWGCGRHSGGVADTVGVWPCMRGHTPAPPKRGGAPCSLAGVGIRVRPWLARGISGGKSTPQGAVITQG